MFAFGIFKVIYSPIKAFKEIAQNPRYLGPILIMILLVIGYTGSAYIVLSKTYNEKILPTADLKDEWTENSTLWTSNVNVSESSDALSGGYYGNKSIQFTTNNDTEIWAKLDPIGPVNCSSRDGYKNMSFRVKLLYPSTTTLSNASLYLFSSQTDYFYYNLTQNFASANNSLWQNLTIPIGPGSQWQNPTSNANWSNITSVMYDFTWSENANVTARVDGLFFRGVFKSLMENSATYVSSFALLGVMQFVVNWVLLGALLYIVARALGGKTVWRTMLILVGFALITLFVQAVINTLAYATLPTVHYPLEYFGGVEGEKQVATNQVLNEIGLVYQISTYTQIVVYVWTIALCAIIIRTLAEFSWSKSALVASAAYFASILAVNFLLGY